MKILINGETRFEGTVWELRGEYEPEADRLMKPQMLHLKQATSSTKAEGDSLLR